MFRFALGNLLSRPLRSVLSLLGLAIAIAGMVGLFAIAGGIDRMVTRTFEQIPGLLVQQHGAPIPIFSTLPAAWAEEIRDIPGVAVVDSEVLSRANVIDGKTIINPPRFLAGLDLEPREKLSRDVYRENVIQGRFLTLDDRGSDHCVVSKTIAEEFDKGVGDTLSVNGFDFEIVGIYQTGSMMLDVNVVMDLETVRAAARVSSESVSSFYVEPDGTVEKRALKAAIEDRFRDRDLSSTQSPLSWFMSLASGAMNRLNAGSTPQNLPQLRPTEPGDESTVEVRMAEDWSERFEEFSGDLNLFLSMITAIGLAIAVLSIVNTMMMSVTERTTEFGILRANGWSRGHIIQLMAWESGLLGICGGTVGVGIGLIAIRIVNWKWADRLQLYAGPELILFGILFSAALGIFGGLYPAWVAARMSPMESIRRG